MKAILVIILATFFLISCGTTQPVSKVETICPKISIPDPPQAEKFPEYKPLVPLKAYTPKRSEVAMARSDLSILELYYKSIGIWMQSIYETAKSHNESVNKQIEAVEKSQKKGWW